MTYSDAMKSCRATRARFLFDQRIAFASKKKAYSSPRLLPAFFFCEPTNKESYRDISFVGCKYKSLEIVPRILFPLSLFVKTSLYGVILCQTGLKGLCLCEKGAWAALARCYPSWHVPMGNSFKSACKILL